MRVITLSALLTPLYAFAPSPYVTHHGLQQRSNNHILAPPLEAFKHTLAILTLPTKSTDRIANEAILSTSMSQTTDKLSIVLRCQDGITPHLHDLRGYVGEIYSLAWDVILNVKEQDGDNLMDVIIYPQNLPNTAAEAWITHRKDLECICSHDSIIGWETTGAMGSGQKFDHVKGEGEGGLDQFVDAVNRDRKDRDLKQLESLYVEDWPAAIWTDSNVVFLEDDEVSAQATKSVDDTSEEGGLIGGYRIPSSSLFNSVAVGGTFDGMHYGHRKLLTLAVSSVLPNTGKLTIGITTDAMLQQKEFAELIPKLDERIKGVRDFVDTLAPGMKNRVKIVPILDQFGPPGSAIESNTYSEKNDYDALVLSHETLETGRKLNQHRTDVLGMDPLTLLCTRRTEAYGMSSTTLRRMRNQSNMNEICDIDTN
jgi:phosphopantetheine adenylyltransferase